MNIGKKGSMREIVENLRMEDLDIKRGNELRKF